MILLDTNMLSALMQHTPDPVVVRWLDEQPAESQSNARIGLRVAWRGRWTARDGWIDADGVQSKVKWTGDWDPIWDDDVDTIIANIGNPEPRKRFNYWSPSWQLRVRFGDNLDSIEAGTLTADQIPPESGLNDEVIAALKAVEDWDLSDQRRWRNTPVEERGEYPILLAYFALGAAVSRDGSGAGESALMACRDRGLHHYRQRP